MDYGGRYYQQQPTTGTAGVPVAPAHGRNAPPAQPAMWTGSAPRQVQAPAGNAPLQQQHSYNHFQPAAEDEDSDEGEINPEDIPELVRFANAFETWQNTGVYAGLLPNTGYAAAPSVPSPVAWSPQTSPPQTSPPPPPPAPPPPSTPPFYPYHPAYGQQTMMQAPQRSAQPLQAWPPPPYSQQVSGRRRAASPLLTLEARAGPSPSTFAPPSLPSSGGGSAIGRIGPPRQGAPPVPGRPIRTTDTSISYGRTATYLPARARHSGDGNRRVQIAFEGRFHISFLPQSAPADH